MLLSASPSSFQPKWVLERTGKWKLVLLLQEKGYITIKTSKGLPDGQEPDAEFVSYVATKEGQAIIDAFGLD